MSYRSVKEHLKAVTSFFFKVLFVFFHLYYCNSQFLKHYENKRAAGLHTYMSDWENIFTTTS